MMNAVAPGGAKSKNPDGFLEDLRSSPVSSLMTFDILQPILADATIDSPRRIKYVFSITLFTRRASQNLMVLLPSHSCGI